VKVGELLAEMADLHKVRRARLIDEPELGGLEPASPCASPGDLCQPRWMGKTQVIPTSGGARRA